MPKGATFRRKFVRPIVESASRGIRQLLPVRPAALGGHAAANTCRYKGLTSHLFVLCSDTLRALEPSLHVKSIFGIGVAPRIAAERRGGHMGKDGRDAERVTTTLSRAQKTELDHLAEREGVATAWIVRRAVEAYLETARGGPMLPLRLEGYDAQR